MNNKNERIGIMDFAKLWKAFVSNDELKPVLSGVYWNAGKNELCATDSHKLFVLKNAADHINIEGSSAILPLEIFEAYQKKVGKLSDPRESFKLLITGKGDEQYVEAQTMVKDTFKAFAGAECIVGHGQYPDYASVIPDESKTYESGLARIGINPVYLNEIFQAVKPSLLHSAKYPNVTLKFTSSGKDATWGEPMMLNIVGLECQYICLLMPPFNRD